MVSSESDACDLTQEVFLALNHYYSTVDYDKVRQWLYNTAHNIVADYYKMKKRESVLSFDECESKYVDDVIEIMDESYGVSDEMIDEYKAKILDNLSDAEMELYDSVYIQKTAYFELARKYAVSETALRKRISRLHMKIIRIVRQFFDR